MALEFHGAGLGICLHSLNLDDAGCAGCSRLQGMRICDTRALPKDVPVNTLTPDGYKSFLW